jgi:hypothetical protein
VQLIALNVPEESLAKLTVPEMWVLPVTVAAQVVAWPIVVALGEQTSLTMEGAWIVTIAED